MRVPAQRNKLPGIVWGGAPLSSESEYAWRVRYFDTDDASNSGSQWSDWARFTTAPDQASWRKTSWINGSAGLLRRDFALPTNKSPVRSAILYASTIGFQELYLNGELLGNQSRYLFEPGQSAYYYRALVTAINVTSNLRRGAGVPSSSSSSSSSSVQMTLGAQLGNGPCSMPGRNSNYKPCHDYGDITMLCCKRGKQEARAFRAILSVTFADGSKFAVDTSSPGEWQTATGPVVQDDLYMGEVYDERLERPGFFVPGYQEAELRPAAAVMPHSPHSEGQMSTPTL
eukprot:COSAG05_NODE_4764_length_1381_cov_1.297192_2_plen_286_part_00